MEKLIRDDELHDKLKEISKELYGDEWYIEKAILTYKAQKGKTYTFYRNSRRTDNIDEYNWCERPDNSNMSLNTFTKNGEVCGWMSESLAEENGLEQITLNDFIHQFVKKIIKGNIKEK